MLQHFERALALQRPTFSQTPRRTVAVVYTVGDPDLAEHRAMAALYGSVFELRRNLREGGREYEIGPLCVRWLRANDAPRDRWLVAWALSVPEGTAALPQVMPDLAVKIEVWRADSIAEAVHAGFACPEAATLEQLRRSIAENGYEVLSALEEEYQAPPRAERDRVTFRFHVEKVARMPMDPIRLMMLDWAFGSSDPTREITALSDIG